MRKLERLKQKDAVHTQDIGDLKKIHLRQKKKKLTNESLTDWGETT